MADLTAKLQQEIPVPAEGELPNFNDTRGEIGIGPNPLETARDVESGQPAPAQAQVPTSQPQTDEDNTSPINRKEIGKAVRDSVANLQKPTTSEGVLGALLGKLDPHSTKSSETGRGFLFGQAEKANKKNAA